MCRHSQVNFSFEGEQATALTLLEATKEITLHSRELYIKAVSFTPAADSSAKQDAVAINYNLGQQPGKSAFTATFVFADDCPAGEGTLTLSYTGCLNNQMAGFYRSGYTAINGEKRVMASTQFEALDARRCFPCVDEPAAKAVFDLSLIVVGDLTAFSNMPETNVTMVAPQDGKPAKKKIKFMPTPKMSTYLVAFCVGARLAPAPTNPPNRHVADIPARLQANSTSSRDTLTTACKSVSTPRRAKAPWESSRCKSPRTRWTCTTTISRSRTHCPS